MASESFLVRPSILAGQPVLSACARPWRTHGHTHSARLFSQRRCSLKQMRSPGCNMRRQLMVRAADQHSPTRQSGQQVEYGEGGFLLKIAGYSVAGAAVVKYGELLLGDVPFSHNLPLAVTMIFGPCIIYSLVLAAWSKA